MVSISLSGIFAGSYNGQRTWQIKGNAAASFLNAIVKPMLKESNTQVGSWFVYLRGDRP